MQSKVVKFKSYIFKNNSKTNNQLLDEIKILKNNIPHKPIINEEKQSILYEIYTSNRLEGNTVTFQDTKLILEDNINVDCKVQELLEVTNLNTAIKRYKSFSILSLELILEIHKTLTTSILSEEKCGNLREEDVFIVGSMHYPPKCDKVKDQLEEEIQIFNSSPKELYDIFMFTFKFTYIHPFIDGNGRTSRVVMNALLTNLGYPRLIIDDSCKKFYYKALEQASVQYKTDQWIRFCYLKLMHTLQYGLVME